MSLGQTQTGSADEVNMASLVAITNPFRFTFVWFILQISSENLAIYNLLKVVILLSSKPFKRP